MRMVWTANLHHQLTTVAGICIGLMLVMWIGEFGETTTRPSIILSHDDKENGRNLVFVGVMTAAKFLNTRAVAVYSTWGKNVPGRIAFFTSEGSRTNSNIPLVPLSGVNDVYPPQKKSFLMLKYMYDHFLDDYEWFMRTDDDIYVRTEMLAKFLRSIKSDRVQFLGQAGLGSTESREELGLDSSDNFCMGGPGMVFSKHTLKKVVPHIKECLQNLYSTHEDVEIGRCIRRYSNVTCTWSYQMQEVFYHNRNGPEAFNGRLKSKEILGATTLHPLKSPSKMYKVHNFFNSLKIQKINEKMVKLRRDISVIKGSLYLHESLEQEQAPLSSYIPNDIESILEWNFFDKTLYSARTQNPHYKMHDYQSLSIDENIVDLLMHIQRYNQQRGRIIQFQEVLFGYLRINPTHSVDYILDILLKYRRYRGKKMTLKVRRHAYIRQQFLPTRVREIGQNSSENLTDVRVNILLPLFGRLESFKRFIENYESICLKNHQNTELVILLFHSNGSETEFLEFNEIKNLVKGFGKKYKSSSIRVHKISGNFSRGLALDNGVKLYPAKSLLVFLDVDMLFSVDFLDRVRKNTIQDRSIYFPIIYSQYEKVPKHKRQLDTFSIDSDVGYWRMYGYGIVSIYRSDYDKTLGFNKNIIGWGLEDVDFFKKIIDANMTVFRSADPGIVHIFHPPSCASTLPKLQYQMCLGTKYSTTGSVRTLSYKLQKLLLDYKFLT